VPEATDFDKMTTDQKLESLNNSLAELRHLLSGLVASNGLEDWVNQKDTESLTGLGKSSLYNLRQRGDITSSTFTGKEVFYRKSSLVRYLDKREKMKA